MLRVFLLSFALITGFFYLVDSPATHDAEQVAGDNTSKLPTIASHQQAIDADTSPLPSPFEKRMPAKEAARVTLQRPIYDKVYHSGSLDLPNPFPLPKRSPRKDDPYELLLAMRANAPEMTGDTLNVKRMGDAPVVKPLSFDDESAEVAAQFVVEEPVEKKNPRLLATLIKREMFRLGCYKGIINARWGAEIETAMAKYADQRGVKLLTHEPSQDILDIVLKDKVHDCGTQVAQKRETIKLVDEIVSPLKDIDVSAESQSKEFISLAGAERGDIEKLNELSGAQGRLMALDKKQIQDHEKGLASLDKQGESVWLRRSSQRATAHHDRLSSNAKGNLVKIVPVSESEILSKTVLSRVTGKDVGTDNSEIKVAEKPSKLAWVNKFMKQSRSSRYMMKRLTPKANPKRRAKWIAMASAPDITNAISEKDELPSTEAQVETGKQDRIFSQNLPSKPRANPRRKRKRIASKTRNRPHSVNKTDRLNVRKPYSRASTIGKFGNAAKPKRPVRRRRTLRKYGVTRAHQRKRVKVKKDTETLPRFNLDGEVQF